MKYVLVLVIVIVVAWVLMGRGQRRGRSGQSDAKPAGKPDRDGTDAPPGTTAGAKDAGTASAAATQTMVGCSHCGLHLPRSEAVADAQGRLYCGDVHRLAGPH